MLFNSIDFAIFLPLTFLIYWSLAPSKIRIQNLFLVAASFLFYGWWDWRFLILLVFSATVDFIVGLSLQAQQDPKKKKLILSVSIAVNLLLLGFFKYLNFFIESFSAAYSFFGHTPDIQTLKIVLPVGISFYSFQAISYAVDVYRGKLQPTRDVVAYFAFISFFPQLVAGPIERATNLLPQFNSKRVFTYEAGSDGMRLILWGLFKKVVVADNCAVLVNAIFADYEHASRFQLVLGAVCFSFQIYGDFSGYSDIAIGTARLFGFKLMANFKTPYFSRDVGEFWRRWHISLTSWFRDYLYIPLGGSRVTIGKSIRNTFIVFIISGLWHGANWTFIFWGLINAIYFTPLLLTASNRTHLDTVAEQRTFPTIKELSQMIATFCAITVSWIFFRSDSLEHALHYFISMVNPGNGVPQLNIGVGLVLSVIMILITFEWIFRKNEIPFSTLAHNSLLRYAAYSFVVSIILFFGAFVNPLSFIYFQF